MKKIISFTFILTSLLFMSSCFLFKPVQKTCPAYSLNQNEDKPSNLALKSNDELLNEISM